MMTYDKNYIQQTNLPLIKGSGGGVAIGLTFQDERAEEILFKTIKGVNWNNQPLKRYMTGEELKDLFAITLTEEEAYHPNFLKGFYRIYKRTGNTYGGIYDVKMVALSYQKQIQQLHPNEWKKNKLRMVTA
ncbi:hypothetical protein SAMN05192533_102314 [Mesobacillus persicus]|uniref:Uncharacterized protein n=1 Tax=Mesobacillus persicus TaxID=930146 RepID=A0A1H7XRZ5_9BACI|nr:hypothetical protein [Mesobacillus persicus]SEM35907.1 hypothetical protein SAMN05192533_102314 [Mesobacillus persicus]